MRIAPYQPVDFNDFWKTRIEGWMMKDVRACVDQNINIGGCTLIFCYIDFFGSILKPKFDVRNRFYYFIEHYLAKYNKKYFTYKCMLYENFRCGLVHEFVMKKGAGIFRGNDPNDKGYTHFGTTNEALYLDLIKLERDFSRTVGDIKYDLDNNTELKQTAIKYLQEELKWALPNERL